MGQRIVPAQCCGVIVDVQEFFLSQLSKALRSRIMSKTQSLVGLLGYLRIPLVVTLERPLEHKGSLPPEIGRRLPGNGSATVFEKDFFDLTRETAISKHLKGLRKKQLIVAGCETDVCVLQSCLGLKRLGYEVYVVEELLFSSSRNVEAAIERMKADGVIFLTYKSLYYELLEAVGGSRHMQKIVETCGPFPRYLSDPAG